MNQATFERVKQLAADLFGVPAETLTRESSPETVENWDSVQHLNLVLEIEQAFGVPADMDNMEKLNSLGAMAEWAAGGSQKQ